MKKLSFIALALLLSVGTAEVSAQSFLKKLSNTVKKEVEKQVTNEVKKQVSKGIDKLTDGKQEEQPQQQQEQAAQQAATQQTVQPQQAAPAQAQAAQPQAQPQAQAAPHEKQKRPSDGVQEAATIDDTFEYGPITGDVGGHKWVDMGLPSGTRWAVTNLDAAAPEQPGKHYAWGEIASKTSYTTATSKQNGKDIDDISGNKTYDAAAAKWGSSWRMPTEREFSELVFYCNWKYVQKGGRWGVEFTNYKNGNTLFLPATGSKDGTATHEASGCGMYWTSTPYKDAKNNGAHEYHFGAALGEMGIGERYYGFAIRPVTSYDVKIEIPSSGEINGHKWVDLGLPSGTKWATCDVGSESVDDISEHYSWGEVITYFDESGKKNKMSGKQSGDIAGNPTYDVARAKWGGSWRLPTEEEFKELIDNCTFEHTRVGRRLGMKVTSKTNGNYIFLPASGNCRNRTYDRPNDIDKIANYWTSTPARGDYHYEAYGFCILKTSYYMTTFDRNAGASIRPVSD